VLSQELRRYAEDPAPNNPGLPPDAVHRGAGYSIFFGATPSVTMVGELRLRGRDLVDVVEEIRDVVRRRGHTGAAWSISTSSEPPDLAERLVQLGFVRSDEEPLTVMARERPPGVAARTHASIHVHPVQSLDELLVARQVDRDAFELGPVDDDWLAQGARAWAREQTGRSRTYLAHVGDTPAGSARSLFDTPAVMLLGGAVLREFRGRGVYRALIDARQADAAAAGTPALVAHANSASRPILERFGFEQVATVQTFYDPAS
jgi:GNAT superfamily N-acetyltransferase